MNLHPTYLETLVRTRTETLMHEARQERIAQAATNRQAHFRFSSLLRRPSFATARADLAVQAGC